MQRLGTLLLLMAALTGNAFAQGTPGTLRCSFNGALDIHSTRETSSPVIGRIQCGSPVMLIEQRFGSPHIRTEDGKDGYIVSLNIGQWSIEPEATTAAAPAPAAQVPAAVRQQAPQPVSSPRSPASFPRVELYGGYSFMRPDIPNVTGDAATDRVLDDVGRFILGNVLGWGGSATVNVTKVFGITGDFSEHRKSLESSFEGSGGKASATLRTFLGGATFKSRGERVQPFAHVLFGLGRVSASVEGTDNTGRRPVRISENFHENGLAAIGGGGVDIVVSRNVSVRAIEFDYFPYRTSGGIFTLHNLQWRSGIVFQLP